MESTMADTRRRRVAEFIEPFRVMPGSKVKLGRDFDPAFNAVAAQAPEGAARDPFEQAQSEGNGKLLARA